MYKSVFLCFLFSALLVSACDSSGEVEDSRSAADTTSTVGAEANIFAAGLEGVPYFRFGRGVLPVEVSIFDQDTSVVFSDVEGMVTSSANAFDPHGADGGLPTMIHVISCEESAECEGVEGISGIVSEDAFFFLTGVFLTDSEPTSPAPETRDVTGANQRRVFSNLQIGQVFFIGDGRTSDGELQRFKIPPGATRLYLGFPDTINSSEQGPPAFYKDNEGALDVVYHFESAK